MNLINKLIEKIKAKKQFDFVNFDSKFKHNHNLAEKNFMKMQRGVSRFFDRNAIDFYIYDPFAEVDKLKSIMLKQTNSEGFSLNLSNIVVCAKIYAANYMATDEGKTYEEIKFACERLCEMVDGLNFTLMAHINYETDGYVKYVNGAFHTQRDSYASSLIEMINYINNTMMEIAQGIYNRDRDAVYNAFLSLSHKDIYLFDNSEKEIFEL